MSLKNVFKTLTLLAVFLPVAIVHASIISEQNFDRYLRWNFSVSKDALRVKKEGKKVYIRTLRRDLFEQLSQYFKSYSADNKYISKVDIQEINQSNNVATIVVSLNSDDIELFSFSSPRGDKLVMDFWNDSVSEKNAAVTKAPKKVEIIKAVPKNKKKVARKKAAPRKKVAKAPKRTHKVAPVVKREEKPYRDFRYGASFMWDYQPISPKLDKVVNLGSKTPEYFYSIKDRDYKKSDKEAHLQATINMYRDKKWGRMYQSMELYAKTYGDDDNIDLNEYLKANALLRINFTKPDKSTAKQAINILENIVNRTSNYELKRGVLKYLLSYYLEAGEHVKAYQLSKVYYVETKEQFDIEETEYAAKVILFSLAQMNQTSVIDQLLKEPTMKKLVPSQLMYAYKIFSLVKLNKVKEALRFYSSVKSQLKKPIHPSIMFNIGECYFRLAKFEKAINMFDQFSSEYSYMTSAERARVRLALSYEILEKDVNQTLLLYKNAINRSQSHDINYEARIRYVGLRSVRKRKLTEEDREVRVFLERGDLTKSEMNRDLLKLLWLVRMRTFVADQEFSQALSYLNAIPLNTLKPSERRVFEGDGAEIVYGILKENYSAENYSKVIQAWEIYRSKYVDKVASDPFVNYLVGRSYIKLGLYQGFDKQVSRFERIKSSPLRTYPIWNKRENSQAPETLLVELRIIKDIRLDNWMHVSRLVDRLEQIAPKLNKVNYYRGLIADHKNKNADVVKHFETFLASPEESSLYDPYEVAMMMQAYTNALYALGKIERFRKVAKALLVDTRKIAKNNKYMFKVKERVSYLLIEILSGEKTAESSLELEPMIISFKKDFPESLYLGRVNYLLGVAMIANKKEAEGIAILNGLLNDSKVPEYIKEIVKSELSLLKIKNKVI